MNKTKTAGLIVSAGLSKRMGLLKPLISFDGHPFLAHIILKLNQVCQKITIVTGHESDSIKNEIKEWLEQKGNELKDKIIWCYNPDYKKGMLTSLQNGLKILSNFNWIIYHFVDQPNIPHTFYTKFANQIDESYDWIQPQYSGISGHPILLSGRLINNILQLRTNESLRDLNKTYNIKRKMWSCEFPEILQDYDTPKQLNNLIENK